MTDTILYERTGHIGTLVLNNPAKHNSLGQAELEAIQAVLSEVAGDDQVRVGSEVRRRKCRQQQVESFLSGQSADCEYELHAVRRERLRRRQAVPQQQQRRHRLLLL